MNQEQKNKIITNLQNKGAILPCPRCGNKNFTLIDGYFNQSFQKELNNNIVIGGPSIPSISVLCNQCGYIAHHALGALGLMPNKDNV